MRIATAQEIRKQQGIMIEAWQLLKKYYWIDEKDIDWENFIKESGELHRKYNCDFSKSIIIAIIEEINRSYKERQE